MGSLGSSTRTMLLIVTYVPIIVTASTYMRALYPTMPLTSTNITSPRHCKAISRVSLLTPLIEWIYWSLLLCRPSSSFDSLSRMSSQAPLLLTCLDPPKLHPRVKLLPLLWNCPDDYPFFPFFGRGDLLVKNSKSLLLAPIT